MSFRLLSADFWRALYVKLQRSMKIPSGTVQHPEDSTDDPENPDEKFWILGFGFWISARPRHNHEDTKESGKR